MTVKTLFMKDVMTGSSLGVGKRPQWAGVCAVQEWGYGLEFTASSKNAWPGHICNSQHKIVKWGWGYYGDRTHWPSTLSQMTQIKWEILFLI